MAGSDLPSSGGSPPPRSAKRKCGDIDDSAGPLPSRATRSSAAAQEAVAAALRTAWRGVQMARRAAASPLWAARTGRGRGLGERMREVILGVRLARSVRVPDDIAASLFPKESIFPEVSARVNRELYQASVPEWKDAPSEDYVADYRAATLEKLGKIVCPLNMDNSATDEPEKERKEFVDSCNCSHPGSEDCVRVHVRKARIWIKRQLGEEAFKNCGLDAMGEQVGELWTTVDKKKLEDVGKSLPQNKHGNFMDITKKLSPKETKDTAKYYYNVFLPRRLASLTRAEHKKDEAVDTADESSSMKSKRSKSSSRRRRKRRATRI